MTRRRSSHVTPLIVTALALLAATPSAAGPLDPRGTIHIPIGVPNTLDPLKTFVEAEGNFSPGLGSYGIYFWVYDQADKKLYAPTQPGVNVTHGLAPGGLLMWHTGFMGGK